MIINLKNKRYGITGQFAISEDIWTKHLLMHPKRPEEALQNNLSVCYGINVPVTGCMIEKVIENEYRMCQRLPGIISQVREVYGQKDMNSHNREED